MDALARLGITGPADLAAVVARSLHRDEVEVLEHRITEAPYDLEALTTPSRQRVSGTARTSDGDLPFSIFVKVLRSWETHPAFAQVPPEFRAVAAAGLPWDVEPAVYRTELRAVLPPGLTMPETYAVRDLDAQHGVIWMEDVSASTAPWDVGAVGAAARALGRFAVRPAVAAALNPLTATLRQRPVRSYVEGRVAAQIIPVLRSAELWGHPAVDRHFRATREAVLATVERLADLTAELEALPHGITHGDACPRNLLRRSPSAAPSAAVGLGGTDERDSSDELVLIDFGFLALAPLGFDLNQLVIGEAQLSERPAADVPGLAAAAVEGYLAGLADEGSTASRAEVERGMAVCGWIFSGLSALPFEQLGDDPSVGGRLDRLCRERAAVQAHLLHRLERTEPARPDPTGTSTEPSPVGSLRQPPAPAGATAAR